MKTMSAAKLFPITLFEHAKSELSPVGRRLMRVTYYKTVTGWKRYVPWRNRIYAGSTLATAGGFVA
jgi:hypothetical protein